MTIDSAPVKAFPDLEEKHLNDDAAADQQGPLPCGCFRIEVYDFGHRYTCRNNAEAYPNRLPTATVLKRYRPGSGDWDWPTEWADIIQHDGGVTIAGLISDIATHGVREPLLLGDDGRVWDGHHRLLVARLLGIETLPVEYGHDG